MPKEKAREWKLAYQGQARGNEKRKKEGFWREWELVEAKMESFESEMIGGVVMVVVVLMFWRVG